MWEAEPPARLPKLSRAAILPHGDVRCKAKLDATAPAAPCGPQATAQGQSPCKKPGRPFAARWHKARWPFRHRANFLSRTHPSPRRRVAPCVPQKGPQSTLKGKAPAKSRAAHMRPGGTKPDGLPPSGELSSTHPPRKKQARSALRPPKGAAVHAQGQSPCKKPGRPHAARRHKARWPSAIGRICFHAPTPRPAGAKRPAPPKGGAVHGSRAKPLSAGFFVYAFELGKDHAASAGL